MEMRRIDLNIKAEQRRSEEEQGKAMAGKGTDTRGGDLLREGMATRRVAGRGKVMEWHRDDTTGEGKETKRHDERRNGVATKGIDEMYFDLPRK
jgi:hypothetical protein